MDINTAEQAFKYTSDTSSLLSRDQRKFYETNGFLLVKNLVSLENLAQYE